MPRLTAQIDLFGLNSYAGCGATSIAPYTQLNADFASFPAVAYFSEFGCLNSGTRTWSEVAVSSCLLVLGIVSRRGALSMASFLVDRFTDVCRLSSARRCSTSGRAVSRSRFVNRQCAPLTVQYFADSQGLGLTANTTTTTSAITTNADFTRLEAQYAAVTLPTTVPTTATSATPACPSDTNQLSSNNLPPTPNAAECACLSARAWPCVARPNLTPAVVGALLNTGCSLLGQNGGSCAAIASNGQTGVYGNFVRRRVDNARLTGAVWLRAG